MKPGPVNLKSTVTTNAGKEVQQFPIIVYKILSEIAMKLLPTRESALIGALRHLKVVREIE